MPPVTDRAPRRVCSVVCGTVFVVLAVLCACRTQAQTAVPSSQPLNGLELELKRSDAQQAALQNLLREQQTPGSPSYRKWLTPEQFAERFAPEASVAQAAISWLQQQGFQPGTVSRNGMRVSFSGTAGQVQRSLGVSPQVLSAADLQTGKILIQGRVGSPVRASVSSATLASTGQGSDPEPEALLVGAVQANTAAAIVISATGSSAFAEERQELLAEAAAQGITVLQTSGAAADSATASLTVAIPSAGQAIAPQQGVLRPAWQSAAGLPGDGLRAAPDVVLADPGTLSAAITSYAAQHGRLGSIDPWLYRFASDSTIFAHADPGTPVGTWSAADGLGAVNVTQLMRAIAAAEAGTVVTLSVSGTTVTHGQTLTLPVTVSVNGGQPSGSVTVTLRGRSGNTVTLGPTAIAANGSGAYGATFSTGTLPGDVYDISASFDSGTGTTASNTVTTTVNPENVTLSATATAAAVGGTIPVTVTATSASGVGVPSGAVTVTAYGVSATPATYSATLPSSSTSTASAVVNVPATTVGQFTFQANCTSNVSFGCNQPTSFAVTVAQGTPIVTLTSTPEALVANSATQKYDVAVTVAAPAGGTAATPTGTVSLQNNGTPVGTFALTRGAGTYTISLSGTGNSLVAMYNGDTNYAAASSAAVVVNAPLITTTTALTGSPTSLSFGSSTSLTASVTPASYTAAGAPTGTVTFRSSLQGVIGTANLSNGYVTYTASFLQVGTHSITATYSGDSSYATSVSTPVTIAVAQGKVPSTTTLSVSPAQPLAGQNTTLTATVAPNFSVPAGVTAPVITCTGQVTFFSNNVFIANGALSGGTVSVPARLPAGSASLTAVYGGDTQCYGSTSSALVVSASRVASILTLQPSVGYANAGQTIQLKASITGADASTLGLPTGTVTFYDTRGGIQITIGTAVLIAINSNTALAAINVDGSSPGQHNFSAAYSGDGIFLPSASATAVVFFGDFSLSFNPSGLTVPRGGSGTAIASLTASNGFNAAVTLTCTPPGSSQMTCTFLPGSLTPGGSAGFTVTTAAQSSKVVQAASTPLLTGAGATLAALLLMPFARTRRFGALLLLACSVPLAISGCSLSTVDSTNNLNSGSSSTGTSTGGTNATGTPLGTQLLTITATSADGTLRHTYTYPVTVQ